jgi:hypothetical protein
LKIDQNEGGGLWVKFAQHGCLSLKVVSRLVYYEGRLTNSI